MITEMLELPDFAEGEFLYEILKTCNKSMNDEILEYKIEAAGYREYIEMWIHEVKTPFGNKIKIKIENLDQKIFSDEKWVLLYKSSYQQCNKI